MGKLVDGKWVDVWYDTKKSGGKFQRQASQFSRAHNTNNDSSFEAEANRYHLYVSLACPWASRCVIFRKLKKLEDVVTMSLVHPHMLENGWELKDDPINGKRYMHEIYTAADPHYTGRVTVPVLWDKKEQTISCNESSEIIRLFNRDFNEFADASVDFYPEHLAKQIDEINAYVYENVNNGVYKCGFATEQEAYNQAYDNLFVALDKLEERLSQQRYLVGDVLTEADWRFFTTLIRFDSVYYGHFKCNQRELQSYHNLHNYMLELYQMEGIAETVDFGEIKEHYYVSQTTINPTQIVPKGPNIDYLVAHDRDTRFKS
jgi:putative glutathione S-transferase